MTTVNIINALLNDIKTLEREEYFIELSEIPPPPEIVARDSLQHQNNMEIHKRILTQYTGGKSGDYISQIKKIEPLYATEIYNKTIQTTATNMVMVYYSPPYGVSVGDVVADINLQDICKHLLLLIKQLQSINICMFDILPNKIHVQFKNGEWMPVVRDFSSAFILYNTVNKQAVVSHCMLTIGPNIPLVLPSKPLEVWIIRALLQTNATHLTATLLEDVVAKHKDVTPTCDFLNQRDNHCYKILATLVNHPTNDIILYFWQPVWQKKWSVYSAIFMIAMLKNMDDSDDADG